MKNLKKLFSTLVIVLLATGAFAQEKSDAIKAYNAGLNEAQSGNYDAALKSFKNVLTIADQIGDSGLKESATKQIPKMHYQIAVGAYNSFKTSKKMSDLDEAVSLFKETKDVAAEYGDEAIRARSEGIIPQLLYNKSLIQYNNEEFDKADATLNDVINANSNYAIAYYQKGLVANKKSQDIYQVLNWYDKAIEVANATNQGQVSRRATESAHDNLLYKGVKLMEAGNNSDAQELYNLALSYDESSADVHYRISEVANKRTNYDNAIKHATQALALENGGRTDKAKIYFELGFAHQMKGNKAKACDAFSNAAYGSFKSPSEHKMEFELKCESTN